MAIRGDKRKTLQRIVDGQRLMRGQIVNAKYFLDKGYLRLDYAEDPNDMKLYFYITDQGRAALAEAA